MDSNSSSTGDEDNNSSSTGILLDLLNSSSSSSSTAAANITAIVFGPDGTCEMADLTMTIVFTAFCGLAIGVVPAWFDRHASTAKKTLASPATFPFILITVNHLWLTVVDPYLRGQLDTIRSFIADYVRYIAPLVAMLLLLISSGDFGKVLRVPIGVVGLVWLSTSHLGFTGYWPYLLTAVLISLLFFVYDPIRRFVMLFIMQLMMGASVVINLLAFGAIDNIKDLCGHSRNKLILCNIECGTITSKFVMSALAMSFGIIGVLITWVLGTCYINRRKHMANEKKENRANKKEKERKERKKKKETADEEEEEEGEGEEGKDNKKKGTEDEEADDPVSGGSGDESGGSDTKSGGDDDADDEITSGRGGTGVGGYVSALTRPTSTPRRPAGGYRLV